ncbi:hypothetical protein BDW62DRAFT_203714 [Aspergillus aurantiobrunneus]
MPPKTSKEQPKRLRLSIVEAKRGAKEPYSWVIILGPEGTSLAYKFWHVQSHPDGYTFQVKEAPMDSSLVARLFATIHGVISIPEVWENQLTTAISRSLRQEAKRWVTALLEDLVEWEWITKSKAVDLEKNIKVGLYEPGVVRDDEGRESEETHELSEEEKPRSLQDRSPSPTNTYLSNIPGDPDEA